MSGWVLLQQGGKTPPKSPRRRRAWAWLVLLLSAALAPFTVIGAVEAWAALEIVDALVFTFFSAVLIAGVVVACVVLIAPSRKPR